MTKVDNTAKTINKCLPPVDVGGSEPNQQTKKFKYAATIKCFWPKNLQFWLKQYLSNLQLCHESTCPLIMSTFEHFCALLKFSPTICIPNLDLSFNFKQIGFALIYCGQQRSASNNFFLSAICICVLIMNFDIQLQKVLFVLHFRSKLLKICGDKFNLI